jgi:hypothetical protein
MDRSAEDPLSRQEKAAEARRPVEEAGGGVAEGFEESERELVEQASHGEGGRSPEADAFPPEEEEADRASQVYGEADEAGPTER